MKVLKKYGKAFILGMQSSIEYRAAFFLELVSSMFPIVMQYFLWTAIFKSQNNDVVLGYSYHQIIIYVIFANLISKFIASGYFKYEITDDIKNGGLSKYIAKPIGYGGYRISCFLGEKIPQLVFMCAILSLALILFGGSIIAAIDVGSFLGFITSLMLALIIQFLIYFAISAIAFFISEISHLFFVVQLLIDIMSGRIIPINMFGGKIEEFFGLLPFKYIVYFPTNIISGKLTQQEILVGISMQCLWIIILGTLSILIWKKCIRQFVAYGG